MDEAERIFLHRITEEEAHLTARNLIEQHGDSVAAFVATNVTVAIDRVDLGGILRWSTIWNAMSMALRRGTTRRQ